MVLNSMSEKVFRTPKIEPLLKMHFNGFGLMWVLFFLSVSYYTIISFRKFVSL